MRKLEPRWEAFKTLIPENASAKQIEDLRKAFYCGATSMFANVVDLISEEWKLPSSEIEKLEKMHIELMAFTSEVSPKQ